jgi:hypothetical protein
LRVRVYRVRMMAPNRASRRHAGGIAPDALAAVKTASVFESGPRVMAETRFDGPIEPRPQNSDQRPPEWLAATHGPTHLAKAFGTGQFYLSYPSLLSGPCGFPGLCEQR